MRIYLTATSVYWPTEDDDYIDEHGWVDPSWSLTELYEDRADVAPIYVGKSVKRAAESILEHLGSIDDSGSAPTFYGTHEHAPLDDALGRNWTYAAHVEGISDVKLNQLCELLAA